jgi:hypothetical protein
MLFDVRLHDFSFFRPLPGERWFHPSFSDGGECAGRAGGLGSQRNDGDLF